MRRNYVVITSIILLYGCASPMHLHQNDTRDKERLALVRQNFDEVVIKTINGKQVPGYPQQDFYVLPGKHSITAKLNYKVYYSSSAWITKTSQYIKTTCFEASKNKKYVILGKLAKNNWELRVEEFGMDVAINFDCAKE